MNCSFYIKKDTQRSIHGSTVPSKIAFTVSSTFNRLSISSLLLVFCVSTLALGCEEEAPPPKSRGFASRFSSVPKKANKKTPKGPAAQGRKAGQTPLLIPERLRRKEFLHSSGWVSSLKIRGDVKGLRDPFIPDIPELKDQDEIQVDPSSIQRNLVVKIPIKSQDLTFTGSMTGLESNIAMLEDASGAGYNIRVGDIVGRNPEFVRVSSITSNEVRFQPVLGIPQDEALDSPRLLKRLREFEDYSNLDHRRGVP
jgi:hypothetical protein